MRARTDRLGAVNRLWLAAVVCILAGVGIWIVKGRNEDRGAGDGAAATSATSQAVGTRIVLGLGQGVRLADGKLAVRADDGADLLFQRVPASLGGTMARYNVITRQMEIHTEPGMPAAMGVIGGYRLRAFDGRPDLTRLTTGDAATFSDAAALGAGTKYLVAQTRSGEHYLLRVEELETPDKGNWTVRLNYERVNLPLGLPGGQVTERLPGRLIYRDWFRKRGIVEVTLPDGRERVIVADGATPSLSDSDRMAYLDASGAVVITDPAGTAIRAVRLNEELDGRVMLSPDGERLLTTVQRRPKLKPGEFDVGQKESVVAVFDLAGREVAAFAAYDDATWTPDGRIVATRALADDGLFLLSPNGGPQVTIDAKAKSPRRPTVSPDGKLLAYESGGRIWVEAMDGTGSRQALPDEPHRQQRPTFSPDGRWLALVVLTEAGNEYTGDVLAVELATGRPTPVRTATGDAVQPDARSAVNWVK